MNSPHPTGRFHDGFTLIELLVVVAIIVTLIAVLVPSLARAKEKSKATVCLSNLKGVGLAFRMYAQDHDDLLPPVSGGAPKSPTVPIDSSVPGNPTSGADSYAVDWFGGMGTSSFSPKYGLLVDYWGQADIGGCPNLAETDFTNISSGYRVYYGPCDYAYNSIFGAMSPGSDGALMQRKIGAINSPMTKALVWDSVRLVSGLVFSRTPWGYPADRTTTAPPGATVDPNVHGRHLNGMANVIYVDGHAEQVKPYVLSDWAPLASKVFSGSSTAAQGALDVKYNIGFIYDGPNPPTNGSPPAPADINKYYDPNY